MSSINHKGIQKILEDGLANYTWQRRDMFKPTVQEECYKWLEQAYPDIFKEFKAVYDISRPQD